MMKLIIEDDEGRKTVVPVVRDEITIGRQDGNTIRLTERNVSRRHARFYRENSALMLEDLNSYNGVRVNGERITGPIKVKEGDLIEIGDYDLGIQGKLDAQAAAQKAAAAAASVKLSGEMPRVAKKDTTPPPPAEAKPKPESTPPQQAKPAAAPQQPKAAPAPAPAPQPEPAHELEPEHAPEAATNGSGQPAQQAGATAVIRLSDLAKQAPATAARELARSETPR